VHATNDPPNRGDRRGQRWAAVCSVAAVLLVLSPVAENWHERERPRDSFPLSYYPMFSERRGATERVVYLVGLDANGGRRLLNYKYAGEGGLNQVRRQIRRTVGEGRAKELCRQVAEKVARRGDGRITAVQVVTGEYDLDDYFTGRNRQPLVEEIHARRDVTRPRP
jgi:hypothetical protein